MVRKAIDMVTVVQLVEPQIVDLIVVGSSPIGHPILRQKSIIVDSRTCYVLKLKVKSTKANNRDCRTDSGGAE